MSEIADELERMAEEFGKCALERLRARDAQVSGGDLQAAYQEDGCADGYAKSAQRLRERAAELRAQRSGPTYRPQPKPSETKVGQWWSALDENGAATDPFKLRGRPPRFLSETEDMSGEYMESGGIAAFNSFDLLNSANFVYLGDGLEPAR